MTQAMQFTACGPGVAPRFHTDSFNPMFSEWQKMRDWCVTQGWALGVDYMPNARMGEPWYFRTKEQQMLFALRWV
jgi:hypothetical protein